MIQEQLSLKVTFSQISSHLNEQQSKSLYETFNKGIKRFRKKGCGSWSHIDNPADRREVLIDYDSIPAATIAKYNIPSKQEFFNRLKEAQGSELRWKQSLIETAHSSLADLIPLDDAVIKTWYIERLSSLQPSNPEMWKRVVRDYTRLALWMKFIVSADKNSIKTYGFNSLPEFYNHCCELIKKEDLHNFGVNNYVSFLRKIKPFKTWLESAATDGYQEEAKRAALESLVSKKFGKANNIKRSEWHINQIVKLVRFGNQPKSITLFNDLNLEAKRRHKEEVSYETLRTWLNETAIKNRLALVNDGRMKWMNNKMFAITTEGASAPDVLWFGDGETLELFWYDGKQTRRENYCVVMDDFSRKIVGWARGTESHDTVYRSVKNAIEHNKTVAWQFKTDKGPGYKGTIIEDFFDSVFGGGYNHTPAATGRARSKAIEPMFARFREQILAQYYVNHSFGNITSKGPQANPEFIKEHLHEFPTNPEQLDNQFQHAIDLWNSKAHVEGKNAGKTPNELYEIEYDDRRHVSDIWMTDKFWLWKQKPSTYEAGGITFKWRKEEYRFIAPLEVTTHSSEEDLQRVAEFLNENAGRKFDVKFDPDNMDRVALYFNGAFFCYAYNKVKTKRAFYDTSADDSKILHQYWKIQELQEADINDFYSRNDHYAEANDLLKAPMKVTTKKQRSDAETSIKNMSVSSGPEETKSSKYAGISKW